MDDKRFVALLPENLQLKILSLVTSGEGGAPPALPAQAASSSPSAAAPAAPHVPAEQGRDGTPEPCP